MNIEKNTMKELPVSEQPYEKCMERGPAFLSDAELLAVILRSGTQKQTSVELAGTLLSRFCRNRGLAGLMEVSHRELQELPGIGPVKAVQLQAVGELSRRIAKAGFGQGDCLNSPKRIAGFFMEDLRHLGHEELWAAMFNTKCRLLHYGCISRGTVNASIITPREVFLEALRHQAVYVVLLHNHPSGDPTPSREDLALTKRMTDAGNLLEIPLMDHIIIGDNSYLSMKEQGMLK